MKFFKRQGHRARHGLRAPPPQTYFASGANRPGDIRGFAEAGHHLGVAVHEISEDSIRELLRLRGTPIKVFVDSGAFSEIAFGPQGPYVVEPITHSEWRKRLGTYLRLSRSLGKQIYAVAPDMIANQRVTLERLARYGDIVRELARRSNIIVPIQKGSMPMAQFDRAVESTLGFSDYIRGIPMKKDATSVEELQQFLRARQPRRIHLLGVGPDSKRGQEVQPMIAREAPGTEVFWDSVRIRAVVGRGPGRPRPLTLAQERAARHIAEYAWGEPARGWLWLDPPIDYTDAIADPAAWMSKGKLRELAKTLGLEKASARAFMKDPAVWLQAGDPPNYMLPWVEGALDDAWRAYHAAATVHEKKRRATRLIFGYEPRWTWTPRGKDLIGVGPELVHEGAIIRRRGLVRPRRGRQDWVLVVSVTYPDGRTKVQRWRGREKTPVSAKAALVSADRQVGAMGGTPR